MRDQESHRPGLRETRYSPEKPEFPRRRGTGILHRKGLTFAVEDGADSPSKPVPVLRALSQVPNHKLTGSSVLREKRSKKVRSLRHGPARLD